MMHPLVVLCVLLAMTFATPVESREVGGTWTASTKSKASERLQLSLDIGGDGNIGNNFDRSAFTGLTWDEIVSDERVPVRFEMRREAGTIEFEGTFRDGHGAGEFGFVPNPKFPEMLEWLGVEHASGRDVERELFQLAIFDVSTEFIRSMQRIGYKVSLEQFVAFRIFGVDPAYVRAMSSKGFDNLTAEKLVETRIHNVTPEYIQQMRDSGKDLTLDEYVQSRIFQVTPEFADEMGRIGYPGLDHDTLVQFKIHGVSAEFVRDLRRLGYTRVPAEQLVAMRIHGVTPEYIRRVADAGYHKVPVEKLVQMRIFDVDPGMVKALDEGRR
jgi:hypothetical protein